MKPDASRESSPTDSQIKSAFLAHIRHELRTPINAIIGYSEMLMEDAQDKNLLADLHRILAAGNQLLTSVNDILDSKKIEATAELDVESFKSNMHHALRTPIHAVIGYSEMLIEEVEGPVPVELVSDLTKIHTAAERMMALVNSFFDPSKMEATEINTTQVSTADLAMVTALRPLVEDGARDLKGECGDLLVVDDNEMNRDLLRRRLERQGHTLVMAENGRQAFEMLQSQKFDLVLLNTMMPEMSGFEVLQRLKADPTLRDIPVIMLSALDEMGSIVKCIEMGAEDYLLTPFHSVLLRARIDACLEKKRLRDREVEYLRQVEEEKKRSDELLHVILPHEIVKELKATNEVKPRRYENVAVLFCDIVGFTSYCEQHQPEEIVFYLQKLTDAFEDLALRHDLQKIKTIGDSFMATAGLPKRVKTPVLNCVNCGLEMVSTAPEISKEWQVRVGIHVGPVIAGVVGHRTYLFDVWGDTVNTAARVQSHGTDGSVNVSKAAWKQISHAYQAESLGLVEVKGKGKMEIFAISTRSL